MTTINTSDDLLRLLRENADYRDAVRRELLGQELLDLPAKFEAFVAMQTETNRQMTEAIQALLDRAEVTDRRLDKMSNDMVEMHGIMRAQHQGFQRFRGQYAENTAIKQSRRIMNLVGQSIGRRLRWERNLSDDNLRDMLDEYAELPSIAPNDYDSFLDADLIVQATDWNERSAIFYISVEASYTCHEEDIDRAVRNAALLRDITGNGAYAAVAGVRLNARLVNAVNGGGEDAVLWYKLHEEDLDI